MLSSSGLWLVLALFLVVTIARDEYRKRALRLPPGPPSLFLVGNLLQLPSQFLWHKLDEWAKKYGPIYTIWIMGNPTIVVSGVTTAADLLDRHSGATANRPQSIKGEFYRASWNMTFRNRSVPTWRSERRAFHANLNINAVVRFQGVQAYDAAQLCLGLLQHPEKPYHEQVHRFAGSTIFRSLYGGDPFSVLGDDPSKTMERVLHDLTLAMAPGKSVVDTLPFLKPIIQRVKWFRKSADEWFEGARAEGWRLHEAAVDMPGYETITHNITTNIEKYGLTPEEAVSARVTMYLGGQDTTHNALRVMGLAMLHHPSVMLAAQAQLDAVCGDRPPTFEDREDLPYIDAIVKETIRWRPGVPVGVPHVTSEDVEYQGYIIPSGTTIIDNLWSQTRDPSVYSQAEVFDPTRFLDKAGRLLPVAPDTRLDLLGFGHGRRVCPGKDFAVNAIFIAAAYLLWALHFEYPVDAEGNIVTCSVHDFEDHTFTSGPRPFGIVFKPRRTSVELQLKEYLDRNK